MSEVRNTTRVNRWLRLLVRLTFITALGLVLGLLSPFDAGWVGVGCAKNLGTPLAASDWAGEELVAVGWPVGWLDVTMHKDCFEPPSRMDGLAIDWLSLAVNEVIILAGIGLVTWLYARLRRLRIRTMSSGRETLGSKVDARHDAPGEKSP